MPLRCISQGRKDIATIENCAAVKFFFVALSSNHMSLFKILIPSNLKFSAFVVSPISRPDGRQARRLDT